MQTLPFITSKSSVATVPFTSQLRAMATRKLAHAFERKLVSPAQAAAAMRAGEAGVAKLVMPLLYRAEEGVRIPPMRMKQAVHLPSQSIRDMEPFVCELLAEGIISADDWKGVTQDKASEAVLNLALLGVKRIAEEAASLMPESNSTYLPFNVVPQALVSISGDDYSASEIHGNAEAATSGVAVIYMKDHPCVCIRRPDSTEEQSAINCLIEAIQMKSGFWMGIPPESVMEIVDPMLAELISDIRVALGDEQLTLDNIPDSVRESLWDFYGDFPDDLDEAQEFISTINLHLATNRPCEKWQIEDGRLAAWLAKGEGQCLRLCERLYQFWKQLPQYKWDTERECLGEGYSADLFFVWESTFESCYTAIEGMYESGEPSEIAKVRKKEGRKKAGSKSPHVQSFRAAVIGSTITTALARIILDESSY